MKIVPFIR